MEAGAARSALETAAAAGSSAADPGTEWKVSEVLHPHQRVKTLDGWTLSPSDHAAASKKQLLQNYEELQHAHEILKIENEELQLLLDSSLIDLAAVQQQLDERPDRSSNSSPGQEAGEALRPSSPEDYETEVKVLRAELAASRADLLDFEHRAAHLFEVAEECDVDELWDQMSMELHQLRGELATVKSVTPSPTASPPVHALIRRGDASVSCTPCTPMPPLGAPAAGGACASTACTELRVQLAAARAELLDGRGALLVPPPPPPSLPCYLDTSHPSFRTNWTRLVPPSVLGR
jgi:hypothetical protein